jgi:hypothetical protein
VPIEVKRVIWAHEEEELIRDPRCGSDHCSLHARRCMALGITRRDPARITWGRAFTYQLFKMVRPEFGFKIRASSVGFFQAHHAASGSQSFRCREVFKPLNTSKQFKSLKGRLSASEIF